MFIGLTVSGEQAKKKPTPAKKKSAVKTKPAAKPTKTRDDWIAKDFDGEAVDTAMEAKPALDTRDEIWDAMLERFKFWIVTLLATLLILSCSGGAGEDQRPFPATEDWISR